MNKIIRAALAATFPGISVDALLEVINATQNPVTATEKLIGVFEEPKLNPQWKKGTDATRTLIGFEWNNIDADQVKYSCPSISTTTRYFTIEGAAAYDKAKTDDMKRSVMNKVWASNTQTDTFTDIRQLIVTNIYNSSCSVESWIAGHFGSEI